jgi:hypothetical protein
MRLMHHMVVNSSCPPDGDKDSAIRCHATRTLGGIAGGECKLVKNKSLRINRRPLIRLGNHLLLPISADISLALGLTDEDFVRIELATNGFHCTVERGRQDEI